MIYKKNPAITAAELDSEICTFNPESAEYFSLNTTASDIWYFLDEPCSLEKLIEKLRIKYDVNENTCKKEVTAFLDLALKNDLIICD